MRPIVQVDQLEKTFRVGFMRKRVRALQGVSFEVGENEAVGLLGPNGAGKTTTIKVLLGLLYPDAGGAQLFGSAQNRAAMRSQIGYVPENPYIYPYLRADEFLDLCGRLYGMGARARKERSDELIERVGLTHARDRAVGKFSKGMMQRLGLAQAIIHDPQLLILDEPMSGLDPIGRKEVRDLLVEQRKAGKTLLYTSHVLSDVETLCDRVVIMRTGRVAKQGTLSELLTTARADYEIEIWHMSSELVGILEQLQVGLKTISTDRVVVTAQTQTQRTEVLQTCLAHGAEVESVIAGRQSLEDVFTAIAQN